MCGKCKKKKKKNCERRCVRAYIGCDLHLLGRLSGFALFRLDFGQRFDLIRLRFDLPFECRLLLLLLLHERLVLLFAQRLLHAGQFVAAFAFGLLDFDQIQ